MMIVYFFNSFFLSFFRLTVFFVELLNVFFWLETFRANSQLENLTGPYCLFVVEQWLHCYCFSFLLMRIRIGFNEFTAIAWICTSKIEKKMNEMKTFISVSKNNCSLLKVFIFRLNLKMPLNNCAFDWFHFDT